MSEPTPADNTTMVFNALSDQPVSAKSVQVATGLTYRQVTDALETLEARGTAARQHVGTRTLWAIASEPVADAAAEPLSDGQMDAAIGALAEHLDAEPVAADAPADAEPVAEVPDHMRVEKMTKADLLAEANDVHGLNLPKSSTKTVLAQAVTDARNAAYRARLERKAIADGYAAKSAPEVKALAKERGIAGYTKMKKAEIVEALTDQDLTPAEAPAPAAQTAADGPATPEGPWGTPDGSTSSSGELGAVLDDLRSVAPVSAPPAQATRRPRADGAPSGGIVASGAARAWGRGELESTLIQVMAEQPDTDHSPTTLTKLLNERRAADGPIAQGGSVAFALDQAVKKGTARLTQDKPKRYGVVQPALAQ